MSGKICRLDEKVIKRIICIVSCNVGLSEISHNSDFVCFDSDFLSISQPPLRENSKFLLHELIVLIPAIILHVSTLDHRICGRSYGVVNLVKVQKVTVFEEPLRS